MEVRAVFCDIGKSFDRVWHRGLIHKRRAAGVTGEVLAWFKNHLAKKDNKESSFLVLRLIMCTYKQVFHKAQFSLSLSLSLSVSLSLSIYIYINYIVNDI